MPKANRFISVIDIGSNSFQQIIARVNKNHKITYVDRQKSTLRLLDFASAEKRIAPSTMDKAIAILRTFKENAIAFDADIVATASSATREAANGKEFLHLVKEQCNIEVELISGSREAELVFNAVKVHYPKLSPHMCVMDIGGGSFEIVYGTGNEIVFRKSLPLGVVRLSQMFFPDYTSSAESIELMRRHISSVLWNALEPLTVPRKTVFIGTSGAFRIVCNILAEKNKRKKTNRFTITELQALSESVLPLAETTQRRSLIASEPDRADILPASMLLLIETARQMNAPYFLYAPYGLREGILFEKAGLIPPFA